MRIALVANTGWYLFNFRLNLMRVLIEAGHDVFAISPEDNYCAFLCENGIGHLDWPLSISGVNPFCEVVAVDRLRRIFYSNRIDVVLTYTPKGNVYSGLACLGSSRIVMPNVSGLGRVFSAEGWLATAVKMLYRIAFIKARIVFFQNEDDRELFLKAGLISHSRTERIMGSGVDLSRFVQCPLPCLKPGQDGRIVFILVARLIWEKGVAQYVEAARSIKRVYPGATFQILGKVPPQGNSSVTMEHLKAWESEGLVEYLGTSDNVPSILAAVDCVVLPSYYREGVPRSLIEAAAMGRPCITTDMPGCRDVVHDGENGWLCTPRDAGDLENKMMRFIEATPEKKGEMGLAAHRIAIEQFDEQVIIQKYLAAIENIDKDSQ